MAHFVDLHGESIAILCAMHIESVPNRKSHPTILLRESYRADGKVKKRTIANLTNWPEPLVEGLRTLLRGGVALATAGSYAVSNDLLSHSQARAESRAVNITSALRVGDEPGNLGHRPRRAAPFHDVGPTPTVIALAEAGQRQLVIVAPCRFTVHRSPPFEVFRSGRYAPGPCHGTDLVFDLRGLGDSSLPLRFQHRGISGDEPAGLECQDDYLVVRERAEPVGVIFTRPQPLFEPSDSAAEAHRVSRHQAYSVSCSLRLRLPAHLRHRAQ